MVNFSIEDNNLVWLLKKKLHLDLYILLTQATSWFISVHKLIAFQSSDFNRIESNEFLSCLQCCANNHSTKFTKRRKQSSNNLNKFYCQQDTG